MFLLPRTFSEYASGFGDASAELWLGNDVIHHMSRDRRLELRVVMRDTFGQRWEARYQHFHVGSRRDLYRLQLSGYHGNATDSMTHAHQAGFSTADRDNDGSRSHCAMYKGGGWWYSQCDVTNLNGDYKVGIVWYYTVWRDWLHMKETVMMVRPVPGGGGERGAGRKRRVKGKGKRLKVKKKRKG